MDSRPAIQTSSTVNPIDISTTDKATHVYVKNENTLGLQPKFCGPFLITSRPSRSTVEVRVGSFADSSARLQKYHWSHCKIAHLREDASAAERPGPGRPRSSLPHASNTTDGKNKLDAGEKVNKVESLPTGRAEIQTAAGKSKNANEPVAQVPAAPVQNLNFGGHREHLGILILYTLTLPVQRNQMSGPKP